MCFVFPSHSHTEPTITALPFSKGFFYPDVSVYVCVVLFCDRKIISAVQNTVRKSKIIKYSVAVTAHSMTGGATVPRKTVHTNNTGGHKTEAEPK